MEPIDILNKVNDASDAFIVENIDKLKKINHAVDMTQLQFDACIEEYKGQCNEKEKSELSKKSEQFKNNYTDINMKAAEIKSTLDEYRIHLAKTNPLIGTLETKINEIDECITRIRSF